MTKRKAYVLINVNGYVYLEILLITYTKEKRISFM